MATRSLRGIALVIASFCGHLDQAARTSFYAREQGVQHIIRLHRYDHLGIDAMLQAESEWLAEPVTAPNRAGKRRAKFSKPQVEWLQRHHQLVREGLVANTSATSWHAGLRVAQGRTTGPIVTGLSSLGSQYVGPIGIGTVLVPEGCAAKPGTALNYLPQGSAAGSMLEQCHVEDQSQIWMVFDTGSTNLWVSSDLCRDACAQTNRVRYNHSLSQTFVPPSSKDSKMRVEFGTGAVVGPLAVDQFHIGPLTVYNQTFGMIEQEEGSIFKEVPFEGILGLALPQMSFHGVTPVFDNIIQQKALRRNAFAFYFSLDNPAANAVFWGGMDSKFHDGPIEYFKVTDDMYWSLKLESLRIGGQTVLGASEKETVGAGGTMLQQPAVKAIVDTGTTFFTAEAKVFQKIIQMLPEAPCDKMTQTSHPPMVFRLESTSGDVRDFKMDHNQYMVSLDSAGATCMPSFMQLDLPEGHGPGIIFGEVFLRHYFSVFDRGNGEWTDARVGLAPAAQGEEIEQHLKALTKHQPTFAETRNVDE